jgi:arabinofuranan 3-O-arabinosyltransferase
MDLLYALDDRTQSGALDPAAIAPVARLFAADTIWVANDMAFDRFRTPRPELTHDLFAAQPPGLGEPQAYGESHPNLAEVPMIDESALAHAQIGSPVPEVELVPVADPVSMVRVSDNVVVLAGSGDGVVDAAAAGLIHGDEAIIYAADARPDDPAPPDLLILTDSNRDRAHQWRGTQDVVGFTETGGSASDLLARDTADQRLPVFPRQSAEDQTTARIDGLDVRATAYGEPFAYRPEDRPAMAVDGDPSTAWLVADRADPIGQYIEVNGPLNSLSLLQSQQVGASRMISSVRLDFDHGDSASMDMDESSLGDGGQVVAVPEGATWVRITITGVTDRPGATDPGPSAVGFAELGVGTHEETVSLPSRLPPVNDSTGLAVVLTRLRTDPLDRWRSDPEPRLIRAFTLPAERTMGVTVTLHRNDRAPDGVLDALAGVSSAVSNRRLIGDPDARASASVDGDPSTGWTSPFSDAVGSVLTVPLDPTVPIAAITLTQPVDEMHSTITGITVTVAGQSTHVDVPAPGTDDRSTIAIPSAQGDSMTLLIDSIEPRTTVDRRYGEPTALPVSVRELTAAAIRPPIPVARADVRCRDDLMQLDGAPLAIAVDADVLRRLAAGESVDVQPCGTEARFTEGAHRLSTTPGAATGIDVDRVVLRTPPADAPPTSPPTVEVRRTRTTRTATISGCPTGCWLILGEGYNDGWEATMDGRSLGAPRQIAGGFNGWWLAGSTSARTVTMRWTPQRTMWAGLILAALGMIACAALVWRGRADGELPSIDPPRALWPPAPRTSTRRAVVAGGVLVVASALCISPKYGAIAAVLAAAVVLLRRPALAGWLSLGLIAGLAALIVRRQLRYDLVASPSWPAAFDDLHRFGLLAVVLLLTATIVDESPRRETEPVT